MAFTRFCIPTGRAGPDATASECSFYFIKSEQKKVRKRTRPLCRWRTNQILRLLFLPTQTRPTCVRTAATKSPSVAGNFGEGKKGGGCRRKLVAAEQTTQKREVPPIGKRRKGERDVMVPPTPLNSEPSTEKATATSAWQRRWRWEIWGGDAAVEVGMWLADVDRICIRRLYNR